VAAVLLKALTASLLSWLGGRYENCECGFTHEAAVEHGRAARAHPLRRRHGVPRSSVAATCSLPAWMNAPGFSP
jgi:hypothetical protein